MYRELVVGKSTLGGVGNAVNTATKSLEVSALNRTEMAIIKKKKAMIEGTVYTFGQKALSYSLPFGKVHMYILRRPHNFEKSQTII